MKLVAQKPTIKMTKEELKTIYSFLDAMRDDIFEEYCWDDVIEDFPNKIDCNEEFITGEIYDIEIIG